MQNVQEIVLPQTENHTTVESVAPNVRQSAPHESHINQRKLKEQRQVMEEAVITPLRPSL